jgi:DNA-binding response OmpR family regulator
MSPAKKPAAVCVSSDGTIRSFVESSLPGFRLRFCPSASALLKAPPAAGLIIIDDLLPDMSGRDLASVLRAERRTSGLLLVLTGAAAYSPAAAALCFENGADEYFHFPPDPRLFRARLLNLLARGAGRGCAEQKPAERRFGPLRISPEARTVRVGKRQLELTALEFDLLVYFLANEGRVISRGVLLERVWKPGEAGPRSVDKRIEALRAKLGRSFSSKIKTVFGLGYIFRL